MSQANQGTKTLVGLRPDFEKINQSKTLFSAIN